MARPIALIASDLHVRNYDRIWGKYPTLTGDTTFALQQIAEIAGKYAGLQALLLAGDSFEGKLQRSDAIALMGSFLDSILARMDVIFIDGDHDLASPPFMTSLRPKVKHANEKLLTVGGLSLYGLDYVPLGEARRKLATIPACDILLTHQKWADFLPHGDCAFTDVRPGCARLMITGDYHVAAFRQCGTMGVLSPGSAVMQDLGETPDKFVYLLYDDLRYEAIPLRHRPRRDITINSEADFEAMLPELFSLVKTSQEQLPREVASPILRVYYPQDLPDVRRWLASSLGLTCHLFYEPVATETKRQQTAVQQQRRDVVAAGGLPGVIRNFYNEDPAIAEAAVRVLLADNKEEEAMKLFQELQAQGNALAETA